MPYAAECFKLRAFNKTQIKDWKTGTRISKPTWVKKQERVNPASRQSVTFLLLSPNSKDRCIDLFVAEEAKLCIYVSFGVFFPLFPVYFRQEKDLPLTSPSYSLWKEPTSTFSKYLVNNRAKLPVEGLVYIPSSYHSCKWQNKRHVLNQNHSQT